MCATRDQYRHAMRMIVLPAEQVEVNYGRFGGDSDHWTPPAGDLADLPLVRLNDPLFVRERPKPPKQPLRPTDIILGVTCFRRKCWPEGVVTLPQFVNSEGVWMIADGTGQIIKYPFDRLVVSDWVWFTPGEPQDHPCYRES